MKIKLVKLAWWWCKHFHSHISRPINNHYTCLECGRRHRIGW